MQGNLVDFSNIRVTQLLANKFTYLPEPASVRNEILIQSEAIELVDTWDLYVRDNCNDKGVHANSQNLTRQELMGKKEIQEGIESRGWKLYATDKSGKLVLDTLENFNECMKPHYENEQECNIEDVHKSEKHLNTHSSMWCDVLSLGKNAGSTQAKRCKKALIVNGSTVPALGGLRKDHKTSQDPTKGPPLRPLCDGKKGPNAPLANLLCRLLKSVRAGVSQTFNTEVLSTEELLHHVQSWNESMVRDRRQSRRGLRPRPNRPPPLQTSDYSVGSMDVSALYPNCKVNLTSKSIIECFKSSGQIFNNIDREFLVKTVSVLTGGNCQINSLNQFLQIPYRTTTLKSFLKRRSERQFRGPPQREAGDLTNSQVNTLLGIASSISVKTVMENHFFTIGGKIYKQSEGSPIGVDLSVESASLSMLVWDSRFL